MALADLREHTERVRQQYAAMPPADPEGPREFTGEFVEEFEI
jgi:hypothetical protein